MRSGGPGSAAHRRPTTQNAIGKPAGRTGDVIGTKIDRRTSLARDSIHMQNGSSRIAGILKDLIEPCGKGDTGNDFHMRATKKFDGTSQTATAQRERSCISKLAGIVGGIIEYERAGLHGIIG